MGRHDQDAEQARLRQALKDLWPGDPPAHLVASTGSTNADLMRAAEVGAPHGTVLVARHQTAGRGRLQRSWTAPIDTAVACSVVLRPSLPPARWPWLTLAAGLATRDALCEVAEVPAQVKWPNDVLIDERKVVGILAERVPLAGESERVADLGSAGCVLGIGINLTTSTAQLPVPTATSLRLVGAKTTDLVEVVVAVLTHLAARLEQLRGPDPALAADYRAACVSIGREVSVTTGVGPPVRGTVTTVDDDGRIVVATADGPRALTVGDVVHLRPAAAQSQH